MAPTSAPASSQRPTPRPADAEGIMALQRANRIAEGSGERMRKAGEKGRPSAKDFRESAKTAKKK